MTPAHLCDIKNKTMWLFLVIQVCTNATASNHFADKNTKIHSHSGESTGVERENVIFTRRIPQIRSEAASTAAEPRADDGSRSNYVRTDAAPASDGDSKQADPNTTFPYLFKDEGNEKAGQNLINSVNDDINNFSYDKDKIAEVKQEAGEPYYEAPQMLSLDDCLETNSKLYHPLTSNIKESDLEDIDKEKYPDTTLNYTRYNTALQNKPFVNFRDDAFSQRSGDYQKATLSHKLINIVTKSIVERDISSKRLNKRLFKSKPKFDIKFEDTTKPTFIYNPTILDSSDENYVEYEDTSATKLTQVTEESLKVSYTESVWQETDKNKPKIRFSDLPQREKYLIPALKLEEGPFPFQFVSGFFTVIYPHDVPIGLLRDIFWGKFSFPFSLIKSVKLESTFAACALLLACGALVVPAYLACRAALAVCARAVEDGGELCERERECGRGLQLATLMVVMLVCGACAVGMALSGEGGARAAREGGRALRCACADLAAWAAAAARDLRHALLHPADLLLSHYRDDLRNVETLLGEPIRKAISSESGIDLVLESVNDIATESATLSQKVSSLRDLCVRGSQLALVAAERLRELARQLEGVKKQCVGRDASLCETINPNGLELKVKFDLVMHEQQLLQLRALGAENLTRAADAARDRLRALPAAVAAQTLAAREEVARSMEARREGVHRSARVLGDMVRHLSAALHNGSRKAEAVLAQLRAYDAWRWGVMLGCAVASSFVVTLTIAGVICGCADHTGHAKRTFQVSACWMCVVSLALWTALTVTFLFAGHAEVYLCRALWGEPDYPALSALLDRPPGLEGGEPGGVLHELFRDLDNVTVDVPVRDVIRECKEDKPGYSVFRLERVLDINKETAFFEWSELQQGLDKLSAAVDVGTLKTMSVNLTRTMEEMLKVSYVNMAHYRMQYNGPLVGKDLKSLAEQLENVATQLSDLTTSSRVETLASRIRRMLATSIGPLEQLRTELVYRLTELELQLAPFHRQLNTSLSHIRTMQYYVDNQGQLIAQKKVSVYTTTLVSHAAGWRTHALGTAAARAARCRPLYDIFSSGRALLCSRYVASMHGFWLCALCCAALWCYSVPCCLQMIRYYNRQNRQLTTVENTVVLESLNASQQEIMTICDESNWNPPRPPAAPDSGW